MEATQEKLYLGAVLEGLVVVVLGVFQICYLRRLLETKTVI